MSKPRVLISDSMSSQAVTIFEERGIEVVQSLTSMAWRFVRRPK